jgi:hypothetical protein
MIHFKARLTNVLDNQAVYFLLHRATDKKEKIAREIDILANIVCESNTEISANNQQYICVNF